MEVGSPSHQPGNIFKYTSGPQGVAESAGRGDGGRESIGSLKNIFSPGDSNMPTSAPNSENHPFGSEKRKLPQTWHGREISVGWNCQLLLRSNQSS